MADISVLQEAAQAYVQAVLSEFPQAADMGLAVITYVDSVEYGVTLATAEQMRPAGPGPVEATTFDGDELPEDEQAQDGDTSDSPEADTEVSETQSEPDTQVSDTTDA